MQEKTVSGLESAVALGAHLMSHSDLGTLSAISNSNLLQSSTSIITANFQKMHSLHPIKSTDVVAIVPAKRVRQCRILLDVKIYPLPIGWLKGGAAEPASCTLNRQH